MNKENIFNTAILYLLYPLYKCTREVMLWFRHRYTMSSRLLFCALNIYFIQINVNNSVMILLVSNLCLILKEWKDPIQIFLSYPGSTSSCRNRDVPRPQFEVGHVAARERSRNLWRSKQNRCIRPKKLTLMVLVGARTTIPARTNFFFI